MARSYRGRWLTFGIAAVVIVTAGVHADTTRIACVGNSITYGFYPSTAHRDTGAYPALLKKALRTQYLTRWIPTVTDTTINCGVVSSTLQHRGDQPYWNSGTQAANGYGAGFLTAMASQPTVVTICLGTNDSKPYNWADSINSSTQFPLDYEAMIDTFAHLPTSPKVFACLPTACSNNNTDSIKDSVLSKYIIPRIRTAAAARNIPVIDLHTPFIKYVNYTGTNPTQTSWWQNTPPDGVHPQDSGHHVIADIIYEAIVNSYQVVTPLERNTPFKVQFLWYGYAPKAAGNDTLSKPMLAWFPAADSINTGVSAIVVPGGGYAQVADTEGIPVALWLNQHGISAFVLRYRFACSISNSIVTPAYEYPVPMLDIARAMRLVRYRASMFKIDSTKIGVIGFSAGGHLASWLETHYDGGNAASLDSVDQKKDRPDWAFLFYPMVTMESNYVYSPGRTCLLGSSPAQVLVDSLSNERWVTPQTPPTFLDYGALDNTVNPKNSTQFDSALKANSVPQKLMTDPGKYHGFGMAGLWPDTALAWLKSRGILGTTRIRRAETAPTVAGPDFSVAVLRTGLLLRSASPEAARFSIYSLTGKRYAEFAVKAGGSHSWLPPARGTFIVMIRSEGTIRMRTVVFE